MVYALSCTPDAHDLFVLLFGEVPEYQGNESFMLFDPKDLSTKRIIQEDDLWNKEGTQYAIDNLVVLNIP